MLLSSPGFALDTNQKIFDGKTEAQFLSQSVADVARHYNPKIFDQKMVDWSNLIQCLALTYGPRLYNVRAERRAARARPLNPGPARPAGPRPYDAQGAADRAMNGQHRTAPPVNEFSRDVPAEMRKGEIPGIGEIELPADWLGKPN